MVSSVRIARFLSDTLKLPLYAWKSHGDLVAADTVFFVNSSTTFNDESYRAFSQEVMRNARTRVIYVQNDYKIAFHTNWKRPAAESGATIEYWSTIPRIVAAKGGAVVDWNALAYLGRLKPIRDDRVKHLFYYGACRPERIPVLKTRLSWVDGKHVISAPTRVQAEKFTAQLGDGVRVRVDRRDIYDQLSEYATTLYVEDPYSTRNFCSLANRYYEALSAGTAIAISPECVKTFKEAKAEVRDHWVTGCPSDLKSFLQRSYVIAKEQAKLWHMRDRRAEVVALVKQLARERDII